MSATNGVAGGKPDYRVTRLRITNYRGIETRDCEVGPNGVIAKGRNGGGKSSILGAIRAALSARDIGPDAIRVGADRAEILVDMDDISVTRVITPKTSTVKVTKGGMLAAKPQTFLTDLVGTAALDPLELFLAKPPERRARVLEALPVTVTVEQLRQWAPVPDDFDVRGHGLEVVDRARQSFYATRTEANRVSKAARSEAGRLAEQAINVPPAPMTETEALAALAAAKDDAGTLRQQANVAAKAKERTAGARERIEADRARATGVRGRLDATTAPDEESLRKAIDVARAALQAAEDAYRAAANVSRERAELDRDLKAILERVAAQEQMFVDTTAPEVPPQAIAEAEARIANAEATLKKAQAVTAAQAARARADEASTDADAKEAEAKRLDGIVRALSNDAPSALLAETAVIPGLSLDGDDIILDGVRIDALCGAEQMRFAVEIARRLNAKSKILVCDGLERLDGEQFDAFVQMATAGDFQLIGTRVANGDVVLEAIERAWSPTATASANDTTPPLAKDVAVAAVGATRSLFDEDPFGE